MFHPNQVIAAAHINELHAAAAAERLARSARPASNGHNRIAGAVAGLWSILGGAEKTQPMPNLTDYPFRS
jgi:hypothetical protein